MIKVCMRYSLRLLLDMLFHLHRKNDEFKHEDLGQLNSYVGYYKKN